MSALSCLGWLGDTFVNRRINPSGCTRLEDILWLALPGIDPVDLMKTGKTLMLYTLLFYTVPLIDAREYKAVKSKKGKGEGGEGSAAAAAPPPSHDEEAQRATMCLKEWAPQFLDRILLLIREQEGYSNKNPVDKMALPLIHRCVRAFYSSLSASLRELCNIHVAKRIMDADFWPNSKYLGSVLHAIGLTSSPSDKKGLLFFLNLLTDKIIVVTASGSGDSKQQQESAEENKEDGQKKKKKKKCSYIEGGKVYMEREDTPGAAKQHCLYLMSQLMKQAPITQLQPQQQQDIVTKIKAIFYVFKGSSSGSCRDFSQRIMRNVLRALTRRYPVEYKGQDPDKWQQSQWKHWQEWGGYSEDINDLKIKWHVANDDDMKIAADLCEFALGPAFNVIERYLNKDSGEEKEKEQGPDNSSVSADDMCNALCQVMCVQRGANSVLGEFTDALQQQQQKPTIDGMEFEAAERPQLSAGSNHPHNQCYYMLHTSSASSSSSSSSSLSIGFCKVGCGEHFSLLPKGNSSLRTVITSKLNALAEDTNAGVLSTDGEEASAAAAASSDESPSNKRRRVTKEGEGATMMNIDSGSGGGGDSKLENAKVMEKLAESLSLCVNLWLINRSKLLREIHSNMQSRRSRRDEWEGKKKKKVCKIRILNVEYAHYMELLRHEASLENNRRYSTAAHTAITSSLLKLSLNDFKKVRKAANDGLNTALGRYPEACSFILGHLLQQVIERKTASKEQLGGALKVLSFPQVLEAATCSLDSILLVVTHIFSGVCESHEEEQVQAATHAVFMALLSKFCLPVWKEEEQKRVKSIVDKLVSGLGGGSGEGGGGGTVTHWRYRLVAMSLLIQLLLTTPKSLAPAIASPAAMALITGGCVSDLFAMRQLCIRGLAALLATVATHEALTFEPTDSKQEGGETKESSSSSSTLSMQGYKGEKEWNARTYRQFGDRLHQPPSSSHLLEKSKIKSLELGEASFKVLKAFVVFDKEEKSDAKSLFQSLEENHPRLSPNAANQKKQGAALDIFNVFRSRTGYLHEFARAADGVSKHISK
eukprot:jgi/Bigna1/130914/aug1.12_g5622